MEFGKLGEKGVDLLMMDSTNAEVPVKGREHLREHAPDGECVGAVLNPAALVYACAGCGFALWCVWRRWVVSLTDEAWDPRADP